jgi:hypothetical protein
VLVFNSDSEVGDFFSTGLNGGFAGTTFSQAMTPTRPGSVLLLFALVSGGNHWTAGAGMFKRDTGAHPMGTAWPGTSAGPLIIPDTAPRTLAAQVSASATWQHIRVEIREAATAPPPPPVKGWTGSAWAGGRGRGWSGSAWRPLRTWDGQQWRSLAG